MGSPAARQLLIALSDRTVFAIRSAAAPKLQIAAWWPRHLRQSSLS